MQAIVDAFDVTAPVIPDITRRQLRRWLLKQGITDAMVMDAISKLPADQAAVVAIDYQDATEFSARNRTVTQLAASLGLDPKVIPSAFIEASTL